MDSKTKTCGLIRSGEMYTLDKFKSSLGLTDAAFRSLKRAGLPIVRYGKRGYLIGEIVIQFFSQLRDKESESEGSENSRQIFGPSLGLPRNRESEAEVGQNE